jgi:hypothetical protein
LKIGLRAAARYIGRAGRECRAEHKRQINLARDRTDLPLYRRSNIRKPRASRGSDVCNVARQIKQYLQTGRNSEAPSGVCAIDKSAAVTGTEIHPVLTLQAAHGHNEAGVRDIRPIRRDFVFGGWTRVSLGVNRAKDRVCPQQTYLESSFRHGRPNEVLFSDIDLTGARLQKTEQPALPRIPRNQ